MPTIERETVVTPVSDGGSGAALGVLLALILAAAIGFAVYAYYGGGFGRTSVIEHNTTIQQPVPIPSAPALAPSAPSSTSSAPADTPSDSGTSSNQ